MTQKDAEAIEKAIHTTVAGVVSGLLALLEPHPVPEGWVNDTIRERIRGALLPAIDEPAKK